MVFGGLVVLTRGSAVAPFVYTIFKTGISAFCKDSAAALIEDRHIVAAAEDERFTRKKHEFSSPVNALPYFLVEARHVLEDVDQLVFYDTPFLKFEYLLLRRDGGARLPLVQGGDPALASREAVLESLLKWWEFGELKNVLEPIAPFSKCVESFSPESHGFETALL